MQTLTEGFRRSRRSEESDCQLQCYSRCQLRNPIVWLFPTILSLLSLLDCGIYQYGRRRRNHKAKIGNILSTTLSLLSCERPVVHHVLLFFRYLCFLRVLRRSDELTSLILKRRILIINALATGCLKITQNWLKKRNVEGSLKMKSRQRDDLEQTRMIQNIYLLF